MGQVKPVVLVLAYLRAGYAGGCPLASFRHQHSRRATKKAVELAQVAQLFEEVINELRRSSGDSWGDDALQRLDAVDLKSTGLFRYCPLTNVTCDPTRKYREADGRCNNLQNPGWGTANSCMNRLLPPAYQDDPNNAVDCCSPERRHASNCFSIDIPWDDPFFARFGQTCMNVPRSAPCTGCTLGPRQQQDILTSYIDASQVYGSSAEDTMRLRAMSNGLMLHQNDIFAGELLPRSFHVSEDRCSIPSKGKFCFRAGDERVNEHPGLTAMHTTFLRQHNRIARLLGQHNLLLSDEEIFQRTKRIVESQLQHIVYSEWLPVVVGPETMTRFGLTPLPSGFTTYDPSVDATMLNEFAVAAFRLGHTLIDGTFDAGVTDGVTNHLYRLRNESFGLDLIALNLQRAREHGIRPYVDYFHFCTGIRVTSFDELKRYMDNDAVEKYKRLYK
ncbi:hypothetical protein MTO96_022461 [Rhipicephalus appendiculatus]